MKTTLAVRLIGAAGLTVLAASALAQDGGYYYGGLGIGRSSSGLDEARASEAQLGGLATTSISKDDKGTAYKVFGGYQFTRYFGVEGGYFNLGRFGFTTTTEPAGTLEGRIRVQGLNLDLVGTLPMTDRLSAIGRLGAQYAKTRDNFFGTGAVVLTDPNPNKRDLHYKMGVGLQYAFSESFYLRGEAERYRVNDGVGHMGDVDVLSVSLVFPFGRSPAPAPKRVALAEPEAAPMAPPPPPPPPPVVAPVVAKAPPVVLKKVSFSAESLFAFDKSAVGPEGRVALDRFAQDLQGTSYEQISVVGHTDRLGTTAYNQRLSIQRAEAVKAYLVDSAHINATMVTASGQGESAPVTTAEQCKGKKATKALIVCLQPDRRVEIEVSGQR